MADDATPRDRAFITAALDNLHIRGLVEHIHNELAHVHDHVGMLGKINRKPCVWVMDSFSRSCHRPAWALQQEFGMAHHGYLDIADQRYEVVTPMTREAMRLRACERQWQPGEHQRHAPR